MTATADASTGSRPPSRSPLTSGQLDAAASTSPIGRRRGRRRRAHAGSSTGAANWARWAVRRRIVVYCVAHLRRRRGSSRAGATPPTAWPPRS